MFFSPLKFLAVFTIKTLIRIIPSARLPTISLALTNLFTSLIIASLDSVRSFGFIPTMRILWTLRRTIRNPDIRDYSTVIEVIRNRGLNQSATNSILNQVVLTDLKKCFGIAGVRSPLNILFTIFFSLITTAGLPLIKPLLYWLTRGTIGIIATTCGILWNESLSTITFLKDYAAYIKELVENHSHFKIPSNHPTATLVESNIVPGKTTIINTDVIPKDESYWLIIGGVVLLSLTTVLTGLCIADYFYPETVQLGHHLSNGWDTVKSIFLNLWPGSTPGGGGDIDPATSEAISRSSSGSSTSTIRALNNAALPQTPPRFEDITPPSSRVGTPMPNINLSPESEINAWE